MVNLIFSHDSPMCLLSNFNKRYNIFLVSSFKMWYHCHRGCLNNVHKYVSDH